VPDARPLLLALTLEAAPLGVVRLARYAWRRSAYVATLVVEPAGVLDRLAIAAPAEVQHPNVELSSRDN
jgi:hypothetical protein